jgi:CRISPR/Cas system CSM-associated protein Csm2 small subunit
MPDTKGPSRDARHGHPEQTKCQNCGKPFTPAKPWHKLCPVCAGMKRDSERPYKATDSECRFAPDYPDYFDADGVLKCEYVTDTAEEIAGCLGRAHPKMTMHQLRAFYHHVKLQETALDRDRPFPVVMTELCKLKPFARERAEKDKVPPYFCDFIERNVESVRRAQDGKKYFRGFIEHFQAVVAYCAGTIRQR